MTLKRLLTEMPSDEFVSWMAFHRQCPFGYAWEDLNVARSLHAIESTKHIKKLPPVADFMRKPPSPLFNERLRAEAREKKQSERRRSKVRRS
jgi:hypothetical protein